jgi:beta-mannosidase
MIALNGEWMVSGGEYAPPGLSATVPGCIHKDLLRAGLIPDPQFRDNEKLVQWVGETDWTYQREFEIPAELLDHEHVELVCDGLDTLATLRINGEALARTDNMHRRYRFAVAALLVAGNNRLEIAFDSPVRAVRERQAQFALPHWPGDCITPGFSWLRKAHCNFGWDWGQKLATCGIWRPIRLEAWSGARLGDVRIDQEHGGGGVTLTVRPEIIGVAAGCRITLSHQGRELAAAEGTGEAPVHLSVESPRLWWPSGMGDQPLYTVRVEVLGSKRAVLATRELRTGLRTLRLRREKDPWGESFVFEVNGRRFFAKGANWIPTDNYGTCGDVAHYRHLLESAAAANMNMLRVWGGGIYEEDLFYDLCDELGLCVWQDFMFACAGYPLDDEMFVDNIRQEAVDNVRRLQHHACLALWCGNNELELGWKSGWGLLGDAWQPGLLGKMPKELHAKVFDRLLAEVVCDHGGQDYWPGSPHSPTGDRKDSNNPACGDAHLWDVLMEGKPFAFYATCDHRFVSEFGYQSLPSPRLLDRVTEPADRNLTSRIMDWHQRMPVGSGIILRHLAQHLPLPGDFAMTVWATQILHAILLETAIGHWRRNVPRTMGVLNWVLNDVWPGMTNATIDSAGGWKAPQYALRRLYAPLLVSGVVAPDRDAVDVHVSSDLSAPTEVELTWTLLRTDGAVLAQGRRAATVAGLTDSLAHRIELGEYRRCEGEENLLLWIELTAPGGKVSESVVTLVPLKHLNLFDPQLRVEAIGATCRLTVQRPALWVWADAPVGQSWSDNFFHLRPGVEKEIDLPARAAADWHSLKDLNANTSCTVAAGSPDCRVDKRVERHTDFFAAR